MGGRFEFYEDIGYWLDDVRCKGNEQSLFECPHRMTGVHNCGQGERAGVQCLSMYLLSLKNILLLCSAHSDIGIHLLPGETASSGIIELSIKGEWRSVCHNGWNDKGAQVACKTLGFPYGSKFLYHNYGVSGWLFH